MAQIDFRPGITWANLPPAHVAQLIDLDYLRGRLAIMRAEWEAATGGDLSSVTLDLGMLLNDLDRMISGEL